MRKWFRRTKQSERATGPLGRARFQKLPAHVDLRQTTTSHPATPPDDPYGGRDTERDFILCYGDPFDD